MLGQWWHIDYNADPTLSQNWLDILGLLVFHIAENTTRWNNYVLILAQRLRRLPNIKT